MRKLSTLILFLFFLFNLSKVLATNYYNRTGTRNCNVLADWTTDPTGAAAGPNPASFTTSGDLFTIRAGTSMSQSGNWTCGAGVNVTINGTLNNSGSYTINIPASVTIAATGVMSNGSSGSVTIGSLTMASGAAWNKSNTGAYNLTTASLGATSTFNFTQGSNTFDARFNYGNVIFNDPFNGPPTICPTCSLQVQNDLTLLDVGSTFVLSTTNSFTHSIGRDLIINLSGGSEYLIVSNGSGSPVLNVGRNLNYIGTGGFTLSNSSGSATMTVTGTSTFNNSFTNFTLANSTGNASFTSGACTFTAGIFEGKSTTSAAAANATITINSDVIINGGTLAVNNSTGGTPTLTINGNVTMSSGAIQGSTNKGNANVTITGDLIQTAGNSGVIHVSNDVNLTGTGGNVVFDVKGNINLGANAHMDLSFNDAGGNNLVYVGGSLTATGGLIAGPHCHNHTTGVGPTVIFKAAATPTTGTLWVTAGDWDTPSNCTTGSTDSRVGIGQFNVEIQNNRIITLLSNIELGTNRTFTVQPGGTVITGTAGGTAYTVARRSGGFPTAAASTNTSFVLSNTTGGLYATIDANSTSGTGALMKAGTFSGNIQTDTRFYGSTANYKFSANAAQVTGDFITASNPTLNTVNKLIVNNTSGTITTGLTLSNPVTITTDLTFVAGRLKTTIANIPTIDVGGNSSGYALAPGNTAYVDGPVIKKTNTIGIFTFPVGKSSSGGIFRPIEINTSSSAATTFRAELMYSNPTASGFNTANISSPTINWINPGYFWHLIRLAGTSDAQVKEFYDSPDLASSSLPYSRYLVQEQWNSVTSKWDSTGKTVDSVSVFKNVSGPVMTTIPSGVTNPFDIGSTSIIAVPLKLLRFSAKINGNQNLIAWSTASETGIEKYILEKSEDGTHFISLATINCLHKEINQYEIPDQSPQQKRCYYRLKIVESSGKRLFSSIVTLDRNTVSLINEVYPNPSNGNIRLFLKEFEPGTKVEILNVTGQIILNSPVESDKEFYELNIENNPKGVYFLKVSNNKGSEIRKIIKN